jgi:hypothetical protein
MAKALSVILPTTEQTNLLRACLRSNPSREQAWQRWQESEDGLKAALSNGALGIKILMPLLHVSGVVKSATDRTYVRSAYLREKLRSSTYLTICEKVLSALATNNIGCLVLKGAALAETVYQEPALRHCHDIDLLVRQEDMNRATEVLLSTGWVRFKKKSDNTSENHRFKHESGLPLELHEYLFRIPYYFLPLDDLWARSQTRIIAGISSRILAPADNLLHILGHASCCKSRESLLWITDASFIIRRYPDLDWDQFVDCTINSHLALPISVMLDYLAEQIRISIPNTVLDRLRTAARQTGATGRAAALLGAQINSSGTFENIMRTTNVWHERLRILQWMLFPPPIYFRWLYGARNNWKLPLYYVRRPFGYVARRIGRLVKSALGVSDAETQFDFRG